MRYADRLTERPDWAVAGATVRRRTGADRRTGTIVGVIPPGRWATRGTTATEWRALVRWDKRFVRFGGASSRAIESKVAVRYLEPAA